jgi:hypothetical protein
VLISSLRHPDVTGSHYPDQQQRLHQQQVATGHQQVQHLDLQHEPPDPDLHWIIITTSRMTRWQRMPVAVPAH